MSETVVLKKSRIKLVLPILAVVALVAGGYFFWKQSKKTKIIYREVKVERGSLSVSILATGTVQPENRLEIKPPIAGRIEKVLVNEGEKVTKGQVLAWMSSTERAALLDAAHAKGAAETKRWEDLYRQTPVLAPINGTVILRNVEPGQTFTSTDAVLVMSDRLTVKAQVDETDIAQIKLKQSAEIVLDAYSTQKVAAVVDQIAFEAKTVNNVTTYLVDVLPERTPDFMRAGMTANVTFLVEGKEGVLLLPSEAVKTDEEGILVLLKTDGENPEKRRVKLGLSDGKRVEIVAGLAENDVVLIAENTGKGDLKSKGANPFSPMGGSGRGGGGGRGR